MVSFDYDVLASCLSFSISRQQTSFTLISIKEYISSTLGFSWPFRFEKTLSVSVVCEPSFSDTLASGGRVCAKLWCSYHVPVGASKESYVCFEG